jgi:hypothetical protein
LAKENDEGYVHLKLEAEATASKIITFPKSKKIQTRNVGELLWPEREDRAEIEKRKKAMGSYDYAAQYQQDPIPPDWRDFPAPVVRNSFRGKWQWHSVREESGETSRMLKRRR